MNVHLLKLEKDISSAREELLNHPLYAELNSLEAMQAFMEQHVFAVWDFMSLLKSLQNSLTCTEIPWFPVGSPTTRRFINEIVLGEESDLDTDGNVSSHFELYCQAMKEVGADTSKIDALVSSRDLDQLIADGVLPETKEFVRFTFEVIEEQKTHLMASVFTFGREDIIPEMFINIVKEIEKTTNVSLGRLIYYLQRHIEVDGDEHGPISLNMVSELCGQDEKKWAEATEVALKALSMRIQLWNGVRRRIQMNKSILQ